ncbi:MAG: hypothetical protein ACE3JK_08230 [Sporolactobacillus sp.]
MDNGYVSNKAYLNSELDLGLSLPYKPNRTIPYDYSDQVNQGNYVKFLTLLAHNQSKNYPIYLKVSDNRGNFYEVIINLSFISGFDPTLTAIKVSGLKAGSNNIIIIITRKDSGYTNTDELNFYVLNQNYTSLFNIEVDASLLNRYVIALNRDASLYSQTPAL